MRTATFKLQNTTLSYDGRQLRHLSGPRNMFVVAQADCEMIQHRIDPDVGFSYQPDPINSVVDILMDRYDGHMIRPASAQKIVEGRIY
jgi:hypothetical protein